MAKLDEILCDLFPEQEFLKICGHDDAVIGIHEGGQKLIYSAKKIVDRLTMSGMEPDEADEFYSFNIECAYVGEKTPLLCEDRFLEFCDLTD